jgi:hypothetical protein
MLKLISMMLFSGVCCAASAQQTPPNPSNTTSLGSKATAEGDVEVEVIRFLLATERHIEAPFLIAGYESTSDVPESYRARLLLLKRQRAAIKQVGAQKLTEFVPQLILFLDYPEEGGTSPSAPDDSFYDAAVFQAWPAYAALYAIGTETTPLIEAFIKEQKHPIQLRFTALQVLREFNSDRAKHISVDLLQAAVKSGNVGEAKTIESISAGKLRFWGKIDFHPISMTVTEIKELLTPEKRLIKPILASNKNHPQHEVFLRQLEAIRNAGDLGLKDFLPNLVLFIDYPRDRISGTVSSANDFSIENRRKKWPAIDAILKIGASAAAPELETLIRNKKQSIQLRLTALWFLTEIDKERTASAASFLIQEAREARDQSVVDRIRAILDFTGKPLP